jgi:hypothetical protein
MQCSRVRPTAASNRQIGRCALRAVLRCVCRARRLDYATRGSTVAHPWATLAAGAGGGLALAGAVVLRSGHNNSASSC